MKTSHARLVQTLSALAVVAVAAAAGHAACRIRQSVELARQSEPLQAAPPGSTASLLIVGDSTGVGTGASSAGNSVVGLIARDHPRLKMVNRAADGAKFADMPRQFGGEERFDMVLVLAGGNDVIRLTGADALARDIGRAAELARAQGRQVVFMRPGNVGNAPFFFPPLSWLMTQRSKTLHRLVRETAAGGGEAMVYVSLYKDNADDPFAQRPDELNAADGLHPSDAGYRIWYDTLSSRAGLAGRLAALRRPPLTNP